MCGIFGTVNFRAPLSESIVYDGLRHRGPDEQGHLSIGNIQLYHTRLAIQDLSSAGKQPMQYHGLSIVFNGEIYNHMELRGKYSLHAESNSDTLTILMLFERMGMNMLDEIDGMFAFALYDSSSSLLYLARDRAGKKPLYLYRENGQTVFSSELNVLYQVVRPEIDDHALADYLYLGHYYRKSTPYKHVQELENGHYLVIDTVTDQLVDRMWFDIEGKFQMQNTDSYSNSLDQLEVILDQSVKRRMNSSDLTVGSFLSGGIDSGIVTAMAAGKTSRLKTFTVKVPGSFDESHLAARVSERYNTDHNVVEIDFSHLQDDVEKILINYGEPVSDNSVIPSYYVAREAKKHLTVALNGDGADELFGGYRRYVPFAKMDFFKPNSINRWSAGWLTSVLPIAHEKQSNYTYLYRLLKFASYSDPLKVYCSASSDLFVGFEDQFLLKPEMKELREDLQRVNHSQLSSLKKIMLMDYGSMLFGRLLPKMDIATMSHSLEGRSPFLSKELLEFAPGLGDRAKVHHIRTKVMLRDLAKRYLPDVLINQPKRGFEVPIAHWVDHELKDIIDEYLLAPDPLYAKLIKREFIEKLMGRKLYLSDERRAKILFCVFSMEVWYHNLKNRL